MKGDRIYYDWTIEELDEHEDILDVNFYDTLNEILKAYHGDFTGHRIGLCYRLIQDDGELLKRGYAYFDENGTLEVQFDDGKLVATRYLKEADAWRQMVKWPQ